MSSSLPPPPPPPPPASYERGYYPVPAAPPAELIVFLLAWVVALIVTVAADSVDWPQFLTCDVLPRRSLHHLARDREGRQGLRAPLATAGFLAAPSRTSVALADVSSYLLASVSKGQTC